jgi:hypothetical protein
MTREEHQAALDATQTLIPPAGKVTSINRYVIPYRTVLASVEATLPTEVADAEGVLRRSERKTTVQVIDPYPGETPCLYEMGIPIVETGDRWHLNVLQKVPLNFDRDNVTPAYLRRLRVLVLNAMHQQLTKEDANQTWVRDAGSDENASDEAMTKVMDLRFGEKRVAYDPSDPEANARAVVAGYTVVHGSMLNASEWGNVKRAAAVLPAGKVTPSPKPFSPDGEPLKMMPEEKWTAGMARIVQFAKDLARYGMGIGVRVDIANDSTWPFSAAYGGQHLTLNLGRLGYKFFNEPKRKEVVALLVHEFAHHYESNHLSTGYYDACCKLAGEFAELALESPELFNLSKPCEEA